MEKVVRRRSLECPRRCSSTIDRISPCTAPQAPAPTPAPLSDVNRDDLRSSILVESPTELFARRCVSVADSFLKDWMFVDVAHLLDVS